MSRSRNIKPGFFANEYLAECSPLSRLLFAGLWCEADRAGRLEDRPKRIKVAVLPYDECNVDDLLSELAEAGFIHRYEVGESKYIQILAFEKHQNPHKNECASTIPAPDEHSTSTVQVPEVTRSAPDKDGTTPADSLNLIPDSLNPPLGEGASAPSRNRGSRLPPDWRLPDTWAAEAKRLLAELGRLDIPIAAEAEKFRDHWSAKSGKDATKTDWLATWRNWIRRTADFSQKKPSTATQDRPRSLEEVGL